MRKIVVIAHDIRSAHNVGSLLRTADGFGVSRVFLTGYTPFPLQQNDPRLPHISQKITTQIHKTALGAESLVPWAQHSDVRTLIGALRADGFSIAALEQSTNAIALPDFKPPEKLAILLGREVEGVDPALLELCDAIFEIPMFGGKESFNVVQAAAVALYHCKCTS